jgi:hypothetical protein
MDAINHDLYAGYLRAVEFFNSQIERKYSSEETLALFRQSVLTEAEFPRWWEKVSADPELKCRWLQRFEDPAGYFARTCQQISEELDRIPIQKVAA